MAAQDTTTDARAILRAMVREELEAVMAERLREARQRGRLTGLLLVDAARSIRKDPK